MVVPESIKIISLSCTKEAAAFPIDILASLFLMFLSSNETKPFGEFLKSELTVTPP